jgi:hypothetical protein
MSRIVNNRPPYERVGIVRKLEVASEWNLTRPCCDACGKPRSQMNGELNGPTTHHIIGGSGRSDEACNLLCLCVRCHWAAEITTPMRLDGVLYEPLSEGVCLSLKQLTAPGEHNPDRLARLKGGALEEYAQLPLWLAHERQKYLGRRGGQVYAELDDPAYADLAYWRGEAQRLFDSVCVGMNAKARRARLHALMGPNLRISEYTVRQCEELRDRILGEKR